MLVSARGTPLCVDTWAALELSHAELYRASTVPTSPVPSGTVPEVEAAPCEEDIDTSGVEESDPSPRP